MTFARSIPLETAIAAAMSKPHRRCVQTPREKIQPSSSGQAGPNNRNQAKIFGKTSFDLKAND